MSLPARILAGLLVLLLAFASGWGAHARYTRAKALEGQLQISEDNREAERLATRSATRRSDALTQDRLATVRHAAGLELRLRQLADSSPGPAPGCAGRNDDARPAAAVLSDEARGDLVALAQDADAVADRLRACQAAVISSAQGVEEP